MVRSITTPGRRGDADTRRGQSEIIGVVLLVAIVVVIAGAVAQFVFGLDIIQGKEQAVGPQISFKTTVDGSQLTIDHQSGNTVETSDLTVVGTETGKFPINWEAEHVGDEWGSGESIEIEPDPGETVRIVWESPTTGDSDVLLRYAFPE